MIILFWRNYEIECDKNNCARDERSNNMRYTVVKQHDITDCAAACMAMVCLHYKKETTITSLRDIMGTDIKGRFV